MLNLKIIILLIGVFLMSIGYINIVKTPPQQKNMYKVFPRNVYDEIFFSLPLSDYNDKLYNNMNPVYTLEDASDYRSLFKKSAPTYTERLGEYEMKNNSENIVTFNQQLTSVFNLENK